MNFSAEDLLRIFDENKDKRRKHYNENNNG